MEFEIRFRIPKNLNIDEIIEKNKGTFYKNNLKKDRLIFIIDALVNSRANHRKEINEKLGIGANGMPYAPLSSAYLREVVYDYNKYLDFLLNIGVIFTDNQFEVGVKCKGYCFNSTYAGQRLKVEIVSNYKLNKARRRASEKWFEEAKKIFKKYRYLTAWWESDKLRIDLKAAHLWLDEYEQGKIEKITQNDEIVDKERAIKNAIDTTEDFKNLTIAINTKKHRYAFSGEGHRFYNPISNLKRELRRFLTYDGQTLVDVDIKNSQPFLSLALFRRSFWEPLKGKKMGEILALEGISKEMYDKIKNNKEYKHIITLLKTSETSDSQEFSFTKFTDLVCGRFYEYIQENFGAVYPEKFDSRNQVKREVLRIFYMDYRKIDVEFYEPCQMFKAIFPSVFNLFYLIKEVQFNLLANLLQRIESFIVIDMACKTISKKYPETPFLTIHDNIITTKGNEDKVKAILEAEIEKWIGRKANLSCEDLVPIEIPQIIETWKAIPDYEGYEVSSIGNVRGIERKVKHSKWERTIKARLLKTRVNNRGYKDVRLSKGGKTFTKLVHILTAQAFVPNPDNKPYTNHLDGDKLNCHFKNLLWVTHSENIQHAYDTGLVKKMKSKKVIDTCTGELYPSIKEAAKAINISYGTCRNYLNGNIKTNKTCLKLAS